MAVNTQKNPQQATEGSPQLLLPWLTKKEKLTGATVLGIAFTVSVVTLVITTIFAVPKMSQPPPKDYYPDIIIEEKCSTCWEATVFATNSDPFYQWVSASSLPDALDVSQRGTIAYQRASIWRVSAEWNTSVKNRETSLYSSPDPHILGGEFVRHSKTLVWKMTVNWGMSVRYCFTLPGFKDDSCLYTSPIVQVPRSKNSSSSGYAALMVGVPYRRAAPEFFKMEVSSLYLDKRATYLTNFASNARTKPGLSLRRDESRGGYVYEGASCSKASPILVTPDVVSYLGFPSLQCACDGVFCLLGLDFATDESDIVPLKLNASGCLNPRSFWDFDHFPLIQSRTIFYTYSSRWDASVSLEVNLSARLNDLVFDNKGLSLLKGFTTCVEDMLERQAPDNDTLVQRLFQECSGPVDQVVTALSPAFTDVLDRYKTRASLSALMQTFDNRLPREDDADDVRCGLEQGQAELASGGLCAVSLEDLKSAKAMAKLESRLKAFSKVADVKKFMAKQWEQGSSQRSDIVIGVVTAVVTILVTIWSMFNRDLQEVEALLLNWTTNFTRFVEETIGMALFKMGMRAVVLLGVIVWNLFNVFRSLKAVGTEPKPATSGALLQQLSGITFVVTTTSTVQVVPQWIIFYAACSALAFVFVAVMFGVYVRMRYLEEEEKKKKEAKATADQAAAAAAASG